MDWIEWCMHRRVCLHTSVASIISCMVRAESDEYLVLKKIDKQGINIASDLLLKDSVVLFFLSEKRLTLLHGLTGHYFFSLVGQWKCFV